MRSSKTKFSFYICVVAVANFSDNCLKCCLVEIHLKTQTFPIRYACSTAPVQGSTSCWEDHHFCSASTHNRHRTNWRTCSSPSVVPETNRVRAVRNDRRCWRAHRNLRLNHGHPVGRDILNSLLTIRFLWHPPAGLYITHGWDRAELFEMGK